jgi:hypothetical protein
MIHINSHGPPPKLDKSNFVNWQTLMKSHICSASTQLWRSVKLGFHPREPNNLTSREEVEEQLNAIALHIIQQAVPDTYMAHILTFSTAKEAWDHLESLFTRNASIKSSKFDKINSEQENFIMIAGQTPEDMHRRLTALSVALTDHRFKDIDDNWIKRKFISVIMPREQIHAEIICSRADFASMSSDDVLSEFISLTILKKNAKATLACALAIKGGDGPNLALKAKVEEDSKSKVEVEMIDWAPEDVKYAYHEHMAIATKAFWTGRNKNFKSRYNSRGAPRQSGPKVRNCYNCGDKNHFIAECPYEKREENGRRLFRKDRSKYSINKYFLNKNKSNNKKVPTRVLVVHEEYESGGDHDHDNKSSEEAGVSAITTTSTPAISLFGASNENLSTAKHKCLMAKATEVSPKPITKPFTPTSHDANSLKVKNEVVALDEFLTNMQGDTKKNFEALMCQLGEAQELIEQKEARERESANEIVALAQALE